MVEDDFIALQTAARTSVIGTAIEWLLRSVHRAGVESTAARIIIAQSASVRHLPQTDAIRTAAIALTTATLGALLLSQAVPRYVATSIPTVAFVIAAAICAGAAARPDLVATQWHASSLRRITAWLRGA